MRHPFEGIIVPEPADEEGTEHRPSRRSFFARCAAGAAGVAVALLGRSASAQPFCGTGPGYGPGPVYGPGPGYGIGYGPGRATTLAFGEEGGGIIHRPPRYRRPPVTTYALGEEGNRPPVITTRALGEEGGVTTYALGEEGSRPPFPRPPASRPPAGIVTTYALGEEG